MVRATTTVVAPRESATSAPSSGAAGPTATGPGARAGHAGQTYPGAATVADRPYFAAYSGLSSPTGELIGMLYVGVPLDSVPS
jgi:Cache 3/Cache 2 fusion domain